MVRHGFAKPASRKGHGGSTPPPSAQMKQKDLEYLRTHAATGEVFNQQLISTQVETIYTLEKLRKQLKELNKSLDNNNRKGENLEKSNHRLQIVMFLLSLVMMFTAIFGVIDTILKIMNLSGIKLVYLSFLITSCLTGLISFFIGKQIEKWE